MKNMDNIPLAITFMTLTFVYTLVVTHMSFSMRSMADQPIPSTPTQTQQDIQDTTIAPAPQTFDTTPDTTPDATVDLAPQITTATPRTTPPVIPHNVHMITLKPGLVVPRDYAHWRSQ